MRTTEIMVGDWVIGSFGDRGRVVAIDDEDNYKTHHGSVRIEYTEDFAANGEWVDKISPIILTPEILEKNGIKKSEYTGEITGSYFDEDENHDLQLSVENSEVLWTIGFYEDVVLKLHYVHELQHALRLCGLAKLADELKV